MYLSLLWQTVAERESDIKTLQQQLTEASQANDASQATQATQNQSSQSIQASDPNAANDVNQTLQEELAKLRQEVPPNTVFSKPYNDQPGGCICIWLKTAFQKIIR